MHGACVLLRRRFLQGFTGAGWTTAPCALTQSLSFFADFLFGLTHTHRRKTIKKAVHSVQTEALFSALTKYPSLIASCPQSFLLIHPTGENGGGCICDGAGHRLTPPSSSTPPNIPERSLTAQQVVTSFLIICPPWK